MEQEGIHDFSPKPRRPTLTKQELEESIRTLLGKKSKLAYALTGIPIETDENGFLTRATFGNIFSLTREWLISTPNENIRGTYQAFLDFLKEHHPNREDVSQSET
ncbi:hypothetical protein HY623_03110 [Candidatus Uhrbacteria bacterium]|nr:hypothetical protein [Candidatus Uhrbacteria bacterium]